MDRRGRCAAGALLALAACIATTAAAPTASNQTALDLYEGPSEGCYYNFQHYGEGDRIMTNEPCLNCTCHNRMLMCYLRVCPFTKPIGQDCSVEKRADQCCPIVTCPDVSVDLLTSTSTSSPSEYGETGLGKLDRYGCSIKGKYFPEGAKVPPSPNKPCEHCYCIRNMTTCVMQECTLHVDGCTPIYRKDVCCPVRYSCDHPEDEIPLLEDMTTTVRPTPGFLLTTTTLAPVTQMTQDCVHDDKIFADGALIKTEKACEHCYCMKGDIVCVVQECGTPMENEGKNCTSMIPREGQCCPDTYICEGDEMTTETRPDVATVSSFGDITTTLSPPRRVSVEGSGYRSETDEPSTEIPIFESDVEGSGEDQSLFKPTDASDILIQESETSPPLTVTEQDEIKEQFSPSTTEASVSDEKIGEKATTEADKGENTVPSGGADEDSSEASVQDKTSPSTETTTTKFEVATELSAEAKTTALPEDGFTTKQKTTLSEEATTESAFVSKSTTDYHETSQDSSITSEGEIVETTLPSRRKEDGEITPLESTTPHLDESTTKASDHIAPEPIATESTTSPIIEQETQTATSQLTDTDKEVKVPITESNLEITTSSQITEEHTQPATTVQPEIVSEFTTLGKIDFSGTTSANPIENEIDEEPLPTLSPGRIPGEGDCLLDGVTYSHESIVPSSSNCHTSCKCISSIVKCEQIVCSPPPDYMDNCQPMYDSPESCCPTYVCDHPRETVPPQSHSQMAGTESPIPTPSIECAGDQCEIAKDKEDTKPSVSCTSEGCTDDTSKQPGECGSQGCDEVGHKPEDDSAAKPSEECVGDSCVSSEQCASGKCETAIPKDQTCNNENGCEVPVVQTCQGDNCAIQPDVTAPKDDSTPCDDRESCKGSHVPEKSPDCNGDSCISELPQQTIPQEAQGCKDGNDCAFQPNVTASKDDSAPCDGSEGCKSSQIPETSPDCSDNSCISELPPQAIPQGEQGCKNGEDCAHSSETPAGGECSEEECKTQHIPEVSKPSSGDCSGTECMQQQDHEPHATSVPEIATESSLGVTEEPQKSESMETVTGLPKTTAVEKQIEPSAVTKAPLPNTAEDSSTTTQYVEMDAEKDRDTQEIGTKSPEDGTQTPDAQNQESITESALDKETTAAPLPDVTEEKKELLPEVTPEMTDAPTPKIPDLSGETTTIRSISSETSESTQPTDYSPSVVPEDTKDKDTPDTATTVSYLPHVPLKSSEAIPETTESQELQTRAPDGFDRDGHEETKETTESQEMLTQASDDLDRDGHDKPIKEPEYVQDTEDKVPESTERYTSAPETITDKEVEPTQEHESQEAITTPKSYNTQTTIPDHLETDAPETHTSSTRDEEPGISVSISTTEESVTSKPNDTETATGEIILPGTKDEAETRAPEIVDEAETRAPEIVDEAETVAPEIVDEATPKPEVPLDHESETQSPGLDDTSVKYSITTAPARDTTDEPESQTVTPKSSSEDITPPPIVVDVGTKTPLSIVKDHEHEDDATTISPALAITTDSALKETESPESEQLPESTAKPGEAPYEKPVSGIERMPSISDEERPSVTTEISVGDLKTTPSAIAEDELPTKQSVPVSDVTAIPETETRTDSSTTSVPTVSGAISSEPSVTEGSSVPQEESTDSPLITSIPSEDIETKSPIAVTESFLKPTSEGIDITSPNQEQMNEDTTELPELVVHEHPTEPSLVEKEPEQPVTEDTTSNLSDEKPLETTSQRETSDEPTAQDAATIAPESHITEPHKDLTTVTEEYVATKSPEISQPETTEAHKDEESPETEFEKEVTNGLDSQASTLEPEIIVTDAQKEATESPPVTSAPKVTEAEISTKDTESPPAATGPEVFVTEHHKDTTDTPVSHDMVTITSDIDTKPDKESTDLPIDAERDPHKESSATPESITTVSEISSTESHKEATEIPELQDTVTKVPDISKDESEKESTNEPKLQDVVTSVPETSVTEPQDEASKVPEVIDVAVKVPETPETEPKKDTAETAASQDLTTTGPTESITETAPIEVAYVPVAQDKVTSVPDTSIIEPEKDVTEAPTYDGSSSYVPDVHATEPQKEVTEAPATEGTATESQKDTPEPELQEPASSAPEVPETEPKKETTENPVSQEVSSTVSEISQTEPKTETTKVPEIQIMTEVPEIATDTKAPESTATDAAKEVTSAPGTQDVTTEAQKEVTDSQKEVTETPEKSVTEPEQNAPTLPPASQNTLADTSEESHKETTAAATIAPEMVATESDKKKTEEPEQELTTTAPEFGQTEAQPGKSSVKDETSTDAPLKITTKFDDQSEPQAFITSTELSKIESDTSVPTVSVLPVDKVTKGEGPLPTESPAVTEIDKSTTGQADADVKKPEGPEGPEMYSETPSVEPTVTDAPISPELVDPATKAPELIDSESSATVTPESPVTEKKDHTTFEEYVTQTPHTSEPQDKNTREPEQTSESKGETTPYSILLEEHTHKTVSPEEEITTIPSDVPSKEYELPTSEAPISITEPALSTETDKSPQEDVPDKDHYVPELTPTAVTEKSTEPSPVSETIITTLSLPESPETEKPQYVESNEISTSAPTIAEEATEKDKPLIPSDVPEAEKEVVVATEKTQETSEDEPILTTKPTTIKVEEEATTPAVLIDKFDKPDEEPKPTPESEKPRPDAEDVPKPGSNEVQPTEEAVQPEEDGPFPPSGTSGYGQEPDYGEEDSFGPGTCRYGGKVYVSAQQIPRDDPCDFCFCFRSDIICLQQSCPPPIHGCHEEPIQGFCCPRYECPVSMATSLNVTTTTTTTTTTLPPHFLPHAYKGAAQRRGCQIKGHTYKVGEVVRASSGPCLHCTCGGDGQMKCDPKVCTPEPMLRQMIAAAVSAKRRR